MMARHKSYKTHVIYHIKKYISVNSTHEKHVNKHEIPKYGSFILFSEPSKHQPSKRLNLMQKNGARMHRACVTMNIPQKHLPATAINIPRLEMCENE